MRPSSSRSELFDGTFARGQVAALFDDDVWLYAMLRVEAALARCQAELGLIPAAAAAEIEAVCGGFHPTTLDVSAGGNPVIPLVGVLRQLLSDEARPHVHKAATSQDIMDSATMLLVRDALEFILADASGAADAAAELARLFRDTPMPARTLLRQALPTTFGLKAAGWLVALDEAADRIRTVRASRLAVQYGGPVGTLNGLDRSGLAVMVALARELGLAEPVLPWHTDRTRIAEIAGALAGLAGVCAKIGRDLTLLAQDEVAEVVEGSPGGSSSMAHKRNPIAAISAIACAMRAPGLASTLFAAMVHEHERAAGAWHAEWLPLRDLLICTGSAVSWLNAGLSGLQVDQAAMQSHVDDLVARLGDGLDVGEAGALVDRARLRSV
jgi:3-carboxy-cis,cis-muconate cycloisomerase